EECRVFIRHYKRCQIGSIHSPIADLVRQYPIRSTHVIAHIRKATHGSVTLENCHPFQRELWGRNWVFAHNGELKDFVPDNLEIYQPVGNTDSEIAFCYILERFRRLFPLKKPPLAELYPVLRALSAEIADKGIFNFLLTDGEHFFSHCSTNLHYIVRQAPFAKAHLIDEDITVDFQELTGESDRVAIIATTPLTDNEVWTKIEPHQLLVFQDGLPIGQSLSLETSVF
ncbi:class II glutamine amidotransferase, partial [Tumidithrix elongata RA019]|nr:class II glutamine amidotransferase [Tumidithrix elongata RA019]